MRLVTRLPTGAPVAGKLAHGVEPEFGPASHAIGAETYTHAVSNDGLRVYFTAEGNLYLRENPEQPQSPVNGEEQCTDSADACTIEIDEAESGSEGGGGEFMWATPNGEEALFLDKRRLTADSTATAHAPDLYLYDVNAPLGERLTDLTVDAGEAAGVLGVSGISNDAGYIYFVAHGVLTENPSPTTGRSAIAGQANLTCCTRA